MLTRVACLTMPGARPFQTGAAAYSASRPNNLSLLKAGHHQQTRTFRFGLWSSYFDPKFHGELQHRHRLLKHKYADALNGRLSWDQNHFEAHPKAVLKHMFRRYWKPAHVRYGFVSYDKSSSSQQPRRSSPGCEYRRTRMSWAPHPWMRNWKSQLDEKMGQWSEQTPKTTARAESNVHGTKESTSAEVRSKDLSSTEYSTEEYLIDPITNRKVPIPKNSVEDMNAPQTESFKVYRAQFTTLTPPEGEGSLKPVYSDGPPPPKELKEYGQIKIDQVPSHYDNGQGYGGTRAPGANKESLQYPPLQGEEYALNHLPPEEPAEQHDDLYRYQAYQHQELHDQTPEPIKRYEDLDKYETYGAEDAENSAVNKPQNGDDLHEYNKPYHYDEGAIIETQTDKYDDLGQYGPYKYQEDTKKEESSPKYEDLDKYKHFKDDNGTPIDEPVPEYGDLNKYHRVNLQDPVEEDRPFQQYGDLDKYTTFKHQELDGMTALDKDTVAESLKEFEAKGQELYSEEEVKPISENLRRLDLNAVPPPSSDAPPFFLSPHQDDHSSTTRAKSREFLERSVASHNEASDAVDREARLNIRKLRTRVQDDDGHQVGQGTLTGNYVRDFPEDFSESDFPEDFSESWGSPTSRSSPEPLVESQSDQTTARIQAAEKQYSDQLSKSSNFAKLETSLDRQQTAEPKIEPALDRRETTSTKCTFNHDPRTQAEVDPYSKEPQGLETSYNRECDGQQAPLTFTKTYGGEPWEVAFEYPLTKEYASPSIPPIESMYFRDPEVDGRPPTLASKTNSKAESTQTPEPMVYKILAYDPIMEKINTAEISDHASPLAPTEALLRVSNPLEFLPHVAPLRAEGFEIVSGVGEYVLVFRQVRPSKAVDKETGTLVNPIDMMGKPTAVPNAAAFVSPTGFINYDMPPVVEETQAPPFRSNIDVRREEPVFSGPKSPTREEARKDKKSIGKRVLVGGAWVAGISYALGVVGEYFMTGGADGRGPAGF
ncbi:hypothetical protein GGR54DRAFT_596476 [Hypoxylon sp. NC1633]|nr:hypothetical protein GGR54DRAFT_596476 [Hypoxylon sp. NC1633]